MARVEKPQTKHISLVVDKRLADRVAQQVDANEEKQTDFVTRALVNQLEKEGDDEIRDLLEGENET